MADRNLTLGVEVDDASTNNAKKRLQELERAQERLAKAQTKYAGDSSKAASAIREGIEKRSKELTNEQKRLERALQQTSKAFIEQQSAAGRAAKGIEAAQSASTQRRGGVTAGGAGAERLRTIGRDIRGLPSVQVPGIGIGTDTFGRAAEVAGRLGVSIGQLAVAAPIAGVAIVAMGLAFKNFTNNAKEQADRLNAVADARRKVGQDIAGGLTTEGADKRQTELTRLREEEEKNLADLQAAYDNNVKSQNALFEGVIRLTPQEQALADQIEKSEAAIAGYTTEQQALNVAHEDGSLAANDAAEAEKRLAAERTQGVLTEASQAGELAELKARASSLTQEQIDSELKALELRKINAEADLASLEASGDTSEEVAKKIAALREELGFLGEKSATLTNARKTARSSEADKAAEKAEKDRTKLVEEQAREREQAEKKSADERKRAADEARRAQDAYTQSVKKAKQGFADALADISTDLGDSLIDNNQKLIVDLNEQSIKFNESELAEEVSYQNELAKIKRDAAKQEKDATRQRDFDAVIQAREAKTDALKERRRTEDETNAAQLVAFKQQQDGLDRQRQQSDREAQRDAERARRDAATNRDRQLRDARDARDTYNAALRDQRDFGQQFVSNLRQMYSDALSATNGAGGSSSTSTSSRRTSRRSGSSSMSFNDASFIQG